MSKFSKLSAVKLLLFFYFSLSIVKFKARKTYLDVLGAA